MKREIKNVGSCVLQVASVDISTDTSADLSVDYRPTIGRLSVDSRPIDWPTVDRYINVRYIRYYQSLVTYGLLLLIRYLRFVPLFFTLSTVHIHWCILL